MRNRNNSNNDEVNRGAQNLRVNRVQMEQASSKWSVFKNVLMSDMLYTSFMI